MQMNDGIANSTLPRLYESAPGSAAVGTGIHQRVLQEKQQQQSQNLRVRHLREAFTARDATVEVSGALDTVTVAYEGSQ